MVMAVGVETFCTATARGCGEGTCGINGRSRLLFVLFFVVLQVRENQARRGKDSSLAPLLQSTCPEGGRQTASGLPPCRSMSPSRLMGAMHPPVETVALSRFGISAPVTATAPAPKSWRAMMGRPGGTGHPARMTIVALGA